MLIYVQRTPLKKKQSKHFRKATSYGGEQRFFCFFFWHADIRHLIVTSTCIFKIELWPLCVSHAGVMRESGWVVREGGGAGAGGWVGMSSAFRIYL